MSIKNSSFETNFRFEFDEKEYRELNEEIISCTLPGLTLGVIEKKYRGAQVYLPGDAVIIDDVTLTFKNDNMFSTWKIIYTWVLDNLTITRTTSSSLYILNRKDEPIFSISLNGLFPFSISEIANTRINNSPEIQTFTVSFKVNQIAINETF